MFGGKQSKISFALNQKPEFEVFFFPSVGFRLLWTKQKKIMLFFYGSVLFLFFSLNAIKTHISCGKNNPGKHGLEMSADRFICLVK